MKNKLLCVFLALLMTLTLASCGDGGDKKGNEGVETYDPMATEAGGLSADDPDAWWKQYTTEPSAGTPSAIKSTTKKGETTKSGSNSDNKSGETTAKSSGTTKKSSGSSGDSSGSLPYTKVDSNTMKYDVSGGTVTLTKFSSNTYIKQTIEGLSASMEESGSASQMMCFTSTTSEMKNSAFVFVFQSSSNKNASTLKYVLEFKNSEPVVILTGKDQDGNEAVKLYFWPCATSGNDRYNTYRESIKSQYGDSNYNGHTDQLKSLLSDNCVKEFLTW